MISITKEQNLELYTDYEKCLEVLKNVNPDEYNFPDGVTKEEGSKFYNLQKLTDERLKERGIL